MSNNDQQQCCSMCKNTYGSLIPLEADPTGLWVCPRCGLVDEITTSARILVDFNRHGIQVDESAKGTKANAWSDWKEAKFEEHVDGLINFYLGITDVRTSIIGMNGESTRNNARKWLDRIIEAERRHFKRQSGHKGLGTKAKLMVVVAIKMALEESAIIVINNKLKAAGIQIKTRDFSGTAKGDDKLPNPSLAQISESLARYPEGSLGYVDRENYLAVLYRRFTRLLRNAPQPVEATLNYVSQVTDRLRMIAETPHEGRGSLLRTRPQVGKHHRDWDVNEFTFFDGLEWDKVLPQAYHLYQLQECVYLWGNRISPSLAIALLFWALQTIKKEVMPSFSLLMDELSAPYGQQKWVALERFKEMRNLLLAWSTSILDAGLPFPLLPLPQKGILGDGMSHYGSDKRRGIPEIDMAVAAAPIISQNWRRILQARFRTRNDAMPFDAEVFVAKKLFVVRAEGYAVLLDPRSNLPHHMRPYDHPRVAGSSGQAVKKFREYAEAARREIIGCDPFLRVRVVSPRKQPVAGSQQPPQQPASQTRTAETGNNGRRIVVPCSKLDGGTSTGPGTTQHRDYPVLLTRPSTQTLTAANIPSCISAAAPSSRSDDAHVGILIREREQYIKFRYSTLLESGHVANESCEKFMWKWLRSQVETGSMPETITAEYLLSIGIEGDPRRMDLGPWVESKKNDWSPVESLLRAGIKPKEIPHQHLPQSVTHLNLLLNQYHHYKLSPSSSSLLEQEGEEIDEDQLDKELELLFEDTGEVLESQFLSKAEVEKRRKEYKQMGILDDGVTRDYGFTPLRDFVAREESENEDLDEDDYMMSPPSSPGQSISTSAQDLSPEIQRIRSTLQRSAVHRDKDGVEALMKAFGGSDSLGFEQDTEDVFEEVMLGSLHYDGLDLGIGMEGYEEGEGVAGIKKGKGKKVNPLGTGARKRKASDGGGKVEKKPRGAKKQVGP